MYSVRIQEKYGPEITPYLDTFHAVLSFSDYSDKNYKIFMKLLTSINIVLFTAGKKILAYTVEIMELSLLRQF